MGAWSKPAEKGWYFDPEDREWIKITPEEYAEARGYVDRGFTQTSAKYCGIGRFDRTVRPWRQLEDLDLDRGVFAAFRELRETDRELQAYRNRESRRDRAKRVVAILRLLPIARAEEFMLDIVTDHALWPETTYSRELGIEPSSPTWNEDLAAAICAKESNATLKQ